MALLYSLNDIDGAARVADELIGLVEAGGTRRARAAAYWNAAGVSEARGDLSGALAMSERAVALLAEDDDERMLARARTACAWFMLRAEPARAAEALELLAKARATLELTGSANDLAYTRVESGQALLLLDRPADALIEAEAAVAAIGDRLLAESASAWLVQATAQAALGQAAESRVSAARAESCLRELPVSRSTAMSFRELGQVHELLGDATLALAAYRTALDLTAFAGSPAASANRAIRRGAGPLTGHHE
jgi:tetratricopeptide (TPR) repeat protein